MRITCKVDSKTRRKLRASLGSRTSRKAGTKTLGRPAPKALLAQLIAKHLATDTQQRTG